MDLIQKKKTNSTLVLVIGWKRELHKQHIMYKTSEVSFIIWWTTSSENIASFYSLMQNRLYWTTCPWVTVFVQLSHTKYHALHPVLNSCGLNSQAPLTMWRTWSYCLSWNVHMLTWCSDLGKNQKEWPTGLTFFYIFYFIFMLGWARSILLSSSARAKPSWFWSLSCTWSYHLSQRYSLLCVNTR